MCVFDSQSSGSNLEVGKMLEPNAHATVFLFENLGRLKCPGDHRRVWEIAEFIVANEFSTLAQMKDAVHPSQWLDWQKMSIAELDFISKLRIAGPVPARSAMVDSFPCLACIGFVFPGRGFGGQQVP